MKSFLGLLFLVFVQHQVFAQRECGSVEYARQLNLSAPMANSAKPSPAPFASRDTVNNEIIYIPVVVHVLYKTNAENISDAQVLSQLEVLNNDYAYTNIDKLNTPAVFKSRAADVRIRFCLAQVDPNGRRTTGIIRKYTTKDVFSADDQMKFNNSNGDNAWNSARYLNIWVCRMATRSIGYATTPGSDPSKDGVVIAYDVFGTVGNVRAPYNKGRTATHEIGHWLGLRHLWGDETCGDDEVADTPRQKYYNFGCPAFPHATDCSVDANGDMFMNFMDFSDDACMNLFTHGQKAKMRSYFALGNARNSFLNSFACDSTLIQGGPLPTDTVVVTPAIVQGDVKIYPNPTYTYFTVATKTNNFLIGKTLVIYTSVGQQVMKINLTADISSINVASLPTGIYVVVIGNGQEAVTTKLVKL